MGQQRFPRGVDTWTVVVFFKGIIIDRSSLGISTWVILPPAKVAWQLSFQLPVSGACLCWGLLSPPGSLLGLSPSQVTQSSSLAETFLAYSRSGLKKIFLILLSKCYQKERSTFPNQIHYPWQMCSVFRVACIQQFPTTGQIISLSKNMICN